MKKIILSALFFGCLAFCFAQSGILDPSFGNYGIVATNMGSAFNYKNIGKQVLIQPGGGMYLVFEANGLTLISKKHADGSQDTTYGNAGISTSVPINGGKSAMQTDGKIVVVGYTKNSSRYYNDFDFAVARFNTNGSLDTSFNGNGMASTDFGNSDAARSLSFQTDGKIIVIGSTVENQGITSIAFARYNTNGSLDEMKVDYRALNSGNTVSLQTDGKIVVTGTTLLRFDNNFNPDSSFNGNGIQTIPFPANATAIQSDGKIIVAGSAVNVNYEAVDFAIARYNRNGSLDSSFGANGMQTTDFGATVYEGATAMAIQTNGSIILAGNTVAGSKINFAVVRYKTNGIPDSSFSGDGKQITAFASSNDYVNAVAIQGDGKIVALGYADYGKSSDVAVARYNADGTPDNSFDGDGSLTDHITQGSTFYTSTAVQSDGKVLAAGYTWNGSNFDFALARYNVNGSPDISFSGDGKQMTDFGSADDKARAITIQSDGKILVAGSAGNNFGLARYNTDGSLDNSFDIDGRVTTDFGSNDSISSINIQKDGKILAGGSALARYNTNGSPDISFDGDGKLITLFNCNAVALQTDGKIVIVSGIGPGSDQQCTVSRYNQDGSVDINFGSNGSVFLYIYQDTYSTLYGKSIAIKNDGKIVVGGYYEFNYRRISSRFALVVLNPDGAFDDTFNAGQPLYTSINSNSYANSVKVQSDGKILLGGYSFSEGRDNFTVARYDTDGTLDNMFSGDGIIVTRASAGNDGITGLAITDYFLCAAGFGQYPGDFGVVARYLLGPEGGPLASTFTTAANGNWNDPGTWIGGVVPYATSQVFVKHTVTISANTTCYSLKVEPPAGNLVITSGMNLTITH